MQDKFLLNILHLPYTGDPCNALQHLKSAWTLNEFTKLYFLRVRSFRYSETFVIFKIFVAYTTFGFFLGSGYSARPGQIVPRGYSAESCQIVPRGYSAGHGYSG